LFGEGVSTLADASDDRLSMLASITAWPAAIPAVSPDEFTLATARLEEVQVTVEVRVWVDPSE
jgi:hypothetical protein